jgi:hypothetical protein
VEALRPMKPFPAPSHAFGMFRDVRGRWGLRCPGARGGPLPEKAAAGLVRVILDLETRYVLQGGVVVDISEDAIWIVTVAHHLPEALGVEVAMGETSYTATVVPADHQRLVRALAEERESAVDRSLVEAGADSFALALLRVERADVEVVPLPIPLADDVEHLASVITAGFTTHPRAVSVLSDLFGEALIDVPLFSGGVMEVGGPEAVGPNVDLSPTVRAREAGGGRAVIVVGDEWATDSTDGGAVLIESHDDGTSSAVHYELGGVVLANHEFAEIGHVTIVVDSAAVRALLRAARSTS